LTRTLRSLIIFSLLPFLFFLFLQTTSVSAQTTGISLVQHVSRDAGSTTSAALAFNATTSARNFIAVLIRAGMSGQTFTVTDSSGNPFHQAVGFDVTFDTPNGHTLGIFYAEDIKGGADTVTVSMTKTGTLRFTILEYSGIATASSLEGAVAAQGTSAAPNSGSVPTTSKGDLLLGAITTANPANFGAASGYTIEEQVPASSSKLIAEDQLQASAGNASASAPLGAADTWAAAIVA